MTGFHWKLPDAPLRTSAVWIFALGLPAVLGIAVSARAALDLTALHPLKAAGGFAAGMVLAIGLLDRHHPFDRFGPGNVATMLRAALVALVTGLIGEPGIPIVAATAGGAALLAAALVRSGASGSFQWRPVILGSGTMAL